MLSVYVMEMLVEARRRELLADARAAALRTEERSSHSIAASLPRSRPLSVDARASSWLGRGRRRMR